MTRAAQLRAEAEALRAKLNDEISPMTRHRVQTLIDELEAEARSFDNGDAGESGTTRPKASLFGICWPSAGGLSSYRSWL